MQNYKIDYSNIIAVLASLSLIFLAISIGSSLKNFFDIPSIIIVLGGTFLTTIACYNMHDVSDSLNILCNNFFKDFPEAGTIAYKIIKVAELSYKRGVITVANNREITELYDKFFREGLKLIADNASLEYLDHQLNQNTIFEMERFKKAIGVFKKASEIAPAMGLIGTMIGLVQMLSNFEDINKIGPAMALALITTFYGSLLSYTIFLPFASKIERNANSMLLIRKIYTEALLSIYKKENPRILENALNNILPYEQKIKYFN
jgi:chemotaxis protein MotA